MLGLWAAFQSRFQGDEEGASMVEYAFLIALIAIIVIAGALVLGNQLDTKFEEVGSSVAYY